MKRPEKVGVRAFLNRERVWWGQLWKTVRRSDHEAPILAFDNEATTSTDTDN
jgi:hypothetical protein